MDKVVPQTTNVTLIVNVILVSIVLVPLAVVAVVFLTLNVPIQPVVPSV